MDSAKDDGCFLPVLLGGIGCLAAVGIPLSAIYIVVRVIRAAWGDGG